MLEDNSCPCKGCAMRMVGCHGECTAYKTWVEKRRKIKKKIKDEEAIRSGYDRYIRENRIANSKRHGKKWK